MPTEMPCLVVIPFSLFLELACLGELCSGKLPEVILELHWCQFMWLF